MCIMRHVFKVYHITVLLQAINSLDFIVVWYGLATPRCVLGKNGLVCYSSLKMNSGDYVYATKKYVAIYRQRCRERCRKYGL